MMATVPHVTSGLGLRKFQADGFLLTRVYIHFLAFAFIRNFYAGSTGLRNIRFFILISLPCSVLFSLRFVYELESLVCLSSEYLSLGSEIP